MAVTKSLGIQVDWIDRDIRRVLKAQDHHRLSQNANPMRERIEVVQRQLDALVCKLKQLKRRCQDRGWTYLSRKYVVRFF